MNSTQVDYYYWNNLNNQWYKFEIIQEGRYNRMYKYLICKKNHYLWLNIASAPAYVKFFNSLMTLDTITDTLWLRGFDSD